MERILLFSDIRRKPMSCQIRFDAKSGTYVKKCSKKKKKRGMFGDISDLGAEDGRVKRAKGFLTFAGISIPTLLYAGGIGALGALGAKYLWDIIINPKDPTTGKYKVVDTSKNTNLKAFAEMLTGGGLGFIVMKLFKQPKLGAALMIGPVVVGIMDLVKPMLPANVQTAMAGLPDIRKVATRSYETASKLPANVKEISGVTTVGRKIPSWTRYPGKTAVMSSMPV
jgi:hypothetical protein